MHLFLDPNVVSSRAINFDHDSRFLSTGEPLVFVLRPADLAVSRSRPSSTNEKRAKTDASFSDSLSQAVVFKCDT